MKSQSIFKFIIFLISLFLPFPNLAQSIKDVRINEIQIQNTNGFRDEYGQAGSWIELYNRGYGKVNLASCTLKIKGEEYRIPKGDPATIIPTQGYKVFFANGTPNKGTFHTNFTLEDTDFVEFYDVDGQLVDNCFRFNPADLAEEASYGWFEGRDGKETLMVLPATTPGSSNNTGEKTLRAESFRKADPAGIVLTFLSIAIVSIVLTLLFFIFKYMGNFHIRAAVKKAERKSRNQARNIQFINAKKNQVITNDELAAIAIALYKYSEKLYNKENMVLTINAASKAYSPWSSKIYGLRQYPAKK